MCVHFSKNGSFIVKMYLTGGEIQEINIKDIDANSLEETHSNLHWLDRQDSPDVVLRALISKFGLMLVCFHFLSGSISARAAY